MILLISASQIARISDVDHWHETDNLLCVLKRRKDLEYFQYKMINV
jgi:hypothetical protein